MNSVSKIDFKNPFITPVNRAGIPLSNCYFKAISSSNSPLAPVKRQRLAKWYWNLHTIEINYAFTINEKLFKRNFSVHPIGHPLPPKQRIASPVIFDFRKISNENTEIIFSIDFGKINEIGSNKTSNTNASNEDFLYAPFFSFQEKDDMNTFLLSSVDTSDIDSNIFGKRVDNKIVSFGGSETNFSLYVINVRDGGRIGEFGIEERYYDG